MKAERADIEDLEVGDIFFVNREVGFCTITAIVGLSFHTGRICFGLEPVNLNYPKRYIEMFFKLNKSVRIYR